MIDKSVRGRRAGSGCPWGVLCNTCFQIYCSPSLFRALLPAWLVYSSIGRRGIFSSNFPPPDLFMDVLNLLLFGHNDFHKIFTSTLISWAGPGDIPLCRLVKPSWIFYDAGSRNFGLQYCNSELTPTEGSLFPLVSSIGLSGCWES